MGWHDDMVVIRRFPCESIRSSSSLWWWWCDLVGWVLPAVVLEDVVTNVEPRFVDGDDGGCELLPRAISVDDEDDVDVMDANTSFVDMYMCVGR